jgi:hypothetical protein
MLVIPTGGWLRLAEQTADRANCMGGSDEPRLHVVGRTAEAAKFIAMSIYAGACGGHCLYEGEWVYGIRYMATELSDDPEVQASAKMILDGAESDMAVWRAMAT